MPFQYKEEEDNKSQQPGQQTGAETVATPSGGNFSAMSTSSGEQTGAAAPTTRHVNLQQYQSANAGQGAAMGQHIADNAGEFVKEATAAAKDPTQQTTLGKAVSGIQTTYDTSGVVDAIKNGKDVSAPDFQNSWNTSYTGPKSLNDVTGYNDAARQTREAGDRAHMSNTYDGRQALVGDQYKRPSYNQGERRLDAFLLGGNTGAIEEQGKAANDTMEAINKAGNAAISQGQSNARTAQKNVRDAYTGRVGTLESGFNQAHSAYAKDLGDYNSGVNDYYKAVRSGNINVADYGGQIDDSDIARARAQGIDLTPLRTNDGPKSFGDYIDQAALAEYNRLTGNEFANITGYHGMGGLEGADKVSGRSGKMGINSDFATNLHGYDDLMTGLDSRVAERQAAYDAAYENALAHPDAIASQYGISLDDINRLAALDGGQLRNFVTKGTGKADYGDVITADEVAKYGGYKNALGLKPDYAANDDLGQGYSFDRDAFMNFLATHPVQAPEAPRKQPKNLYQTITDNVQPIRNTLRPAFMPQERTRDAVQSVAEPMSRPAVETNKAQPLITPISPEAAVNKVVDATKQVLMPTPLRKQIKKWGY
jgi:hypothetical protein